MSRHRAWVCLAALVVGGCSTATPVAGESTGESTGGARTTLALPPPTGSTSSGPTEGSGAQSGVTAPHSAPASTDDRGDVVQEQGQVASLQGPDGDQVVAFSVDAITVDPVCDGPSAAPSERGHLVALSVRVSTGDLASVGGVFSMGAQDFAVTPAGGDPDFDVATAAAADCLADGQQLDGRPLGSNAQYTGTVVLDSPVETGQVLFSPVTLRGAGWTWSF